MSAMTIKYDGEWLGSYVCQFCQISKMHLFKSHGFEYFQIPRVVLNLTICE